MPDKHRQLYDQLKGDGYYTKSYDEFVKQFSNPEKIARLHSLMQKDGVYTKSVDDFKNQFFTLPGTAKESSQEGVATRIKIRDERQDDIATGKPLKDTARFHAEPDIIYIQQVVATARKHNIDPYTALAVNLAETRFTDKKNPFMLGNYDPYGDVIDESMRFMVNTQKIAKSKGKTKEADIIQAWNGYGGFKDKGIMYGIDTHLNPIDMDKNPVYGKRIIDLRDRVLKKNPEFTKVVDAVMATNPALDNQYFK